MKKQISDCNPTINNGTDLMTDDWTFIDKEVYKNNCKSSCMLKKVCWVILDLLSTWKSDEATEYLKNNK
jgi:hypothetical protein